MAKRMSGDSLFALLKSRRRSFDSKATAAMFKQVDQGRVEALAERLAIYIETNLPRAFENRNEVADYRTNPYVLMTSAAVAKLSDPNRLARFLFDSKLYMSLETSFGNSVEAAFVGSYPLAQTEKWSEPPEKLTEFAGLKGLSRE